MSAAQWADGTLVSDDDPVTLTDLGRLALLTDRQRDVLRALVTYHRQRGYYPSLRELAAMLGVHVSSVYARWTHLEDAGVVARDGARAIRILLAPSTIDDLVGQ